MVPQVVAVKVIELLVIDITCFIVAQHFHRMWRISAYGGNGLKSLARFFWHAVRSGLTLSYCLHWLYFAFVVWRRLHPTERWRVIDHLPATDGKLIMAWEHYNEERYTAWVRATGKLNPVLINYGFGFYGVV